MSVVSRIVSLLGISAYQAAVPSGLPALDSREVEEVRRALGGQLSPRPRSQSRWYLSDVEVAEQSADGGDIAIAARMMRAARKDGIFAGVLSTRTSGLVQLPRRFRGNPDIVSELELGHDSIRSKFDEMCPPGELAAMVADGILNGVAVAELVPIEGRDFPLLVRLDPEFLLYRWADNRWYYRSIAGLIPITPGDGRWVLHTPGGRCAPWNGGLWKAVGRAFIRKEHASLHKDNWEAKLANPARVAVAPQGAGEEQKQSWFQAVMAWGINTVFGLTPGYDVKLLESNGRGYESFDGTIARSDNEYTIAIAGQTVTTDGGVGFSNSDVHRAIRADLIAGDGDALAYTINTQVIPPFILARWGEDGLKNPAVVSWDVSPPKDREAEARTLLGVATAISTMTEALSAHDRELDVDALAAKFGIPIRGDRDGDGRPDVEGERSRNRLRAVAA